MNNVKELLHRLERVEVKVQLTGDNEIKVRGKKENLTSELIAELKANKSNLLELLKKNSASNEIRDCVIRASNDQRGPLSFAQQRIWFTESFEENPARYNMPTAALLEGRLDTLALCNSINDVVRRHHVLRTNYYMEDGVPYQHIKPFTPLVIDHLDLEKDGLTSASPALKERIKQEAHVPFDLLEDTMLRAKLIRLSPEQHILLLTAHHIACDGWSMGLLANEIGQNYQRHIGPTDQRLLELPHQYVDYANWQLELDTRGVLEKSMNFWRTRLNDLPRTHGLPLDYPRPAVQSFSSDYVVARVNSDTTQALNDLALKHKTTLYVVLQAALAVLLSRWSNEQDIVIGTPVAGRTHAELEPLIGFFVNTLILRNDVSPELDFVEFLTQCHATTQDAFAHQIVPFDMLVGALKPERSLSQSALVQILFSLRNNVEASLDLSGVTVSGLDTQFETLKFDLELVATQDSDGLYLLWNYATDLFERNSVQNLLTSFTVLLEQIAKQPFQTVSRIALFGDDVISQVLAFGHADTTHSERSLTELFEQWADTTPDAIAIKNDGQSLSYRQLNNVANSLSHYLVAEGLHAGARFSICCDKSFDMVIAMLAVLKLGGAYVLLDPDYPQERLQFMLEDSQSNALLTDAIGDTAISNSEIAIRAFRVDHHATYRNHSTRNLPITREMDSDVACVIYTSGSTGKPKGALIPNQGIVRLVENSSIININKHDRVAQGSNCAFDLAMLEIWGALSNGATLCQVTRDTLLDPRLLKQFLVQDNISVLMLTTALFNQISALTPDVFAGLRVVFFGGEQADLHAINRVIEHGKPSQLINGYGPAENTCASSAFNIEHELSHWVPIGKAISGSYHVVLDQQGQLVPVGVVGELCVGGAGLSKGYLNRPRLTETCFIQDTFHNNNQLLYKTGDMVRYRHCGNLEYIGRADTQVKVRGFRVELSEINSVLSSFDDVDNSIVITQKQDSGHVLLGYLVPLDRAADQVSFVETVKAKLRSRLPDYMVPTSFLVLNALPLTQNGKVDIQALPAVSSVESEEDYVAPIGETELKLAAIWGELLGQKSISRHARFFDIGGHSLLAMKLLSVMTESFSSPVTIRHIFEYNSLSELAAFIDQKHNRIQLPALIADPTTDEIQTSFAQQRLWFVHHLQSDTVVGQYNINMAFRLTGEFNLLWLERALLHIVERHEVLRTSYHTDDGGITLTVNKSPAGLVEHVSCVGLEERVIENKVRAFAAAEFMLEDPCMLRVQVLSVRDQECILQFCLHHIAADGWSMGVLIKELYQLYALQQHGEAMSLAPLPVQYSDFARWQRQILSGELLDKQLAYWSEQLADLPICHNFPLDKPRPTKPKLIGDTLSITISETLTHQLRACAKANKATMFMLYESAFAFLLGRWSHSDDIVIGTPIAGRHHATTEGLIGLFVNTLVLRTDLSSLGSFHDLLGLTRAMAMDAFEHQDVPFEMLVERLSPARSLNHSPLFQILFSMHNNDGVELAFEGAEGTVLEVNNNTVKFDLSLHVVEGDKQDTVVWEYNGELFEPSTVERLAKHWVLLLEQIVAQPDAPLDQLDIISNDDCQRLTYELGVGKTTELSANTLHRQFEQQVERQPDQIALQWAEQRLSYFELNQHANRLAHRLKANGIGSNQLIGICLPRSINMLIAVLAVLKTGNGYVPLDPNYPDQRLAHIVTESGLKTVITVERASNRLPSEPTRFLLDDAPGGHDYSDENLPIDGQIEETAYVLFTSGSTGRPKGVEISHRNVSSLLSWATTEFTDLQLQRILMSTSLNFDPSVFEIFATFCLGNTGVLVENGLSLLEQDADITFIGTVPSVIKTLADHRALPSSLKVLGIGGEVLTSELVNDVIAMLPDAALYNLYGPTECTVDATCMAFNRSIESTPPIGFPLDNIQLHVLSKHQRVLPIGAIGELYIGGDAVGKGYWNRPQMTAERFMTLDALPDAGRVYRTGDMVRFDVDGRLMFLGRIDDQIKIRGFRVELGEIEHQLLSHPKVDQALVLIKDYGTDKRLVAYLVAEPVASSDRSDIDINHVQAFIAAALPEYMVPSSFVVMDSFPLLPNRKVDKKSLPEPSSNTEQSIIKPNTHTESRVLQVWADVLELPAEQISITDTFFSLGGHSLLIVNLLKRINDGFSSTLSVSLVYEQPSIRQMAAYLDSENVPPTNKQPLVLMQQGRDDLPPLFLIHPVGGDLVCYAALVSFLETEQSIYGLQRRELATGEAIQYPSIVALAEAYLQTVRRVQPQGPYHFFGWSLGGMIAIKIAELLEASGETVNYLGVVDTVDPTSDPNTLAGLGLDKSHTRSFSEFCDSMDELSPMLQQFDQSFQLPHLVALHQTLPIDYLRELIFSGVQASLNFSVDKRVRSLSYYSASQTQQKASEAAIQSILSCSQNSPKFHSIEGDHHSLMSQPAVGDLARCIKQDLIIKPRES